MELLSPAGDLEKLKTVYRYGADAAYIGMNPFSLRQKTEHFDETAGEAIAAVKDTKKLYGAFNIYFHNQDIRLLTEALPAIRQIPFDAFIISDIGVLPFFQTHFPDIPLHLSTQANCINTEAAKLYRKMGFSRIILGRETSLSEIKAIKAALPDVELETFVHGAMCLAYSGRCFLSRYLTDRSANHGDCSHACRWKYQLMGNTEALLPESEAGEAQAKALAESGALALREELRPDEYFPIYEGDGFTSILSGRDLCLFDRLQELTEAGIDAFKIEGRMKSLYYAAVITRAYRKALDHLSGRPVSDLNAYREEIFKVSHREFTTGFFFGESSVQRTTNRSYLRRHLFLGVVTQTEALPGNRFLSQIDLKNSLHQDDPIERISPDLLYQPLTHWRLLDENRQPIRQSHHGKTTFIESETPMLIGDLIRRPMTKKEVPEDTPPDAFPSTDGECHVAH